MNILIVEDDFETTSILNRTLASAGHKVEQVETMADALVKIRQSRFHLCLLDLFLPDGMGHQLIPYFKVKDPGMAVVAMTGHNTRELEQEVRREGVLFYMLKPFETRYLKAIVEHIAGDRKHEMDAGLTA